MESHWQSFLSETAIHDPEMMYPWDITQQVAISSVNQCFQNSLNSAESYNYFTSHPIQSTSVEIKFGDVGSRTNNGGIVALDTGPNSLLFCKPKSSTQSLIGSVEKPANSEQLNKEVSVYRGLKRSARIPVSHSQDHIIAERKRRLKLNQKFIALSAIIPGLKKVDKASILGDAARYVKELQARVKDLEEQNKKKTVESVVLVKRSQVFINDEDSSTDENSDQQSSPRPFPEIEAKLSEKTVLLRIHCEDMKGTVVKVLSEIERHHLSIINTNVMPFPGSCLNITVTAQVGDEFSLTMKGLVRELKWALNQLTELAAT